MRSRGGPADVRLAGAQMFSRAREGPTLQGSIASPNLRNACADRTAGVQRQHPRADQPAQQQAQQRGRAHSTTSCLPTSWFSGPRADSSTAGPEQAQHSHPSCRPLGSQGPGQPTPPPRLPAAGGGACRETQTHTGTHMTSAMDGERPAGSHCTHRQAAWRTRVLWAVLPIQLQLHGLQAERRTARSGPGLQTGYS